MRFLLNFYSPFCYLLRWVDQFWSGYFTSRPALKGMVRTTSGLFSGVRAAQCLAGSANKSLITNAASQLQLLEEALGVAQHHDAVSGTAKQHVAFDYAKRLAHGIDQASTVFSESITALRGSGSGDRSTDDSAQYKLCLRLNETVCAMTQLESGSVDIVLWNSLAQPRTELITVPVASLNVTVTVNGVNGVTTTSQTYPAGETIDNYHRNTNETKYVTSFMADLPPLGFTVYTLHVAQQPHRQVEEQEEQEQVHTLALSPFNGQAFSVENTVMAVNFSATGLMTSLTNKASGVSISLAQRFCYYISSTGNHESGQKSGAYIFRPNSSTCYPIQMDNEGATIEVVVRGSVVQLVRQRFSPWLTQTVRLSAGAQHLELEHTVGAIPFKSTTANKTLEQCVSWRQTGGCSPNGPREPQKDLACDKAISGQASGFCECFGGRKTQLSNCGHIGFSCKEACFFTEGREIVSRFNTSIASQV